MDARVKPAHDAAYIAAPYEDFSDSHFKQPRVCVLAPPREVKLLVCLPSGRGEAERRKAHSQQAAAFLPDRRETATHGNACSALRRGVLRPRSVLPGTWQPSAISRRTPVPVQPH